MCQESLLCQLKRQFVPTTDSQHAYTPYPNVAKGLAVEAPEVLWVAEITYIRLPQSFVYLAAIRMPTHVTILAGRSRGGSIRRSRSMLWRRL